MTENIIDVLKSLLSNDSNLNESEKTVVNNIIKKKVVDQNKKYFDSLDKHLTVGEGCDYMTKKEIDCFEWDNVTRCPKAYIKIPNEIVYELRDIQPVTMTGVLYKIHNNIHNNTEYILHVGIAKRNTKEPINHNDPDSVYDACETGREVSRYYAEQSPDFIMRVSKDFNDVTFSNMCESIISSFDLKPMEKEY